MVRRFWRCLIPAILCAGIALGPASAQNEVHFQILPLEKILTPGSEFTLTLRATMAPSWHLYSTTPYPEDVLAAPQPTVIQLEESPILEPDGLVRQPRPNTDYDPNFGIETEYFDGIADFEVPVRLIPTALEGKHEAVLKIRFMACNDRLCLPPRTIRTRVILTVSRGPKSLSGTLHQALGQPAGSAPVSGNTGGTVQEPPPQKLGNEPPPGSARIPVGILAYILFAMAGGGLALLTPCVFPMIPITVSYFTKRDVDKRQAVADAALYSFGIVLTFTLLGFLLTWLFGLGGMNRIAANPVVNIAIATLFIVFALNLFGALEIRLPSSWLTAVDKKSSSMGGTVGILLMALAFSITSFTCTVPFVGTVMVAAARGDWVWSLLGVTAFATVFAAPFFILALFPSWLKSLPRAGSWMNSMKVTMGFLELAAAMKFLSNVDLVYQLEIITRPVFITVWLAVGLVLVLYLLGHFSFPHEEPTQRVGVVRVLSAVFFLSLSFYLLRGLFGGPLGELDSFIPPRDYGITQWDSGSGFFRGKPQEPESEPWLDDYQEALQAAAYTEKPVFIDFTGYTCTNCRWMEANIFARPKVRELLRKYTLVRLYTDGGKPEHETNLQMQRERFHTIALPLYALMTPHDEIIDTFPGLTRDRDEFISFLARGLKASSVMELND